MFCATCYTTIETVRAVQDLHLSIPADISIVGWDDIFELDVVDPPITRLVFNMEDYPRLALEKIRALRRNPDDAVARAPQFILSADLMEGRSVRTRKTGRMPTSTWPPSTATTRT